MNSMLLKIKKIRNVCKSYECKEEYQLIARNRKQLLNLLICEANIFNYFKLTLKVYS